MRIAMNSQETIDQPDNTAAPDSPPTRSEAFRRRVDTHPANWAVVRLRIIARALGGRRWSCRGRGARRPWKASALALRFAGYRPESAPMRWNTRSGKLRTIPMMGRQKPGT